MLKATPLGMPGYSPCGKKVIHSIAIGSCAGSQRPAKMIMCALTVILLLGMCSLIEPLHLSHPMPKARLYGVIPVHPCVQVLAAMIILHCIVHDQARSFGQQPSNCLSISRTGRARQAKYLLTPVYSGPRVICIASKSSQCTRTGTIDGYCQVQCSANEAAIKSGMYDDMQQGKPRQLGLRCNAGAATWQKCCGRAATHTRMAAAWGTSGWTPRASREWRAPRCAVAAECALWAHTHAHTLPEA